MLQDLRIVYLPYASSLLAPADRRRFPWFAKVNNIGYSTVLDFSTEYDLIYATFNANISKILSYKKRYPRVKLVFELIDGHLVDTALNSYKKGISRIITGRLNTLRFDIRPVLIDFLKICDAVICASELQKRILRGLNENVFVIFDYFDDEVSSRHINWQTPRLPMVNLFWEGMVYNLHHLKLLNQVQDKLQVGLSVHIVTDLRIRKYFGLSDYNAKRITKSFTFDHTLYEWSLTNVNKVSSMCNIGVIPIDKLDRMAAYKPENKLLFMWKLGLPVIASRTYSYKKLLLDVGMGSYLCTSCSDSWVSAITAHMTSDATTLSRAMSSVDKVLSERYSSGVLQGLWLNLFRVLFKYEKPC